MKTLSVEPFEVNKFPLECDSGMDLIGIMADDLVHKLGNLERTLT